jgi:N4-gp56 family major capsid protein
MSNPIMNKDLSIQQKEFVRKQILVALKDPKTSFWDKFCSHERVNDGHTSYEWRKLNIPDVKLDDLEDLQEGITPEGLDLTYVSFNVQPVDFGTYIEYTDKSVKYNFDDVKRDAGTRLSHHAFETVELRKGRQFVSGTFTMTPNADNFFKDLSKARIILRKNKVRPLTGSKYGCILTTEQSADILEKYQDKITHTSQKEAIIDGYIGELNGFILYENTSEVLYPSEGKGYALFIGKTEYGLPVKTVSFGDDSVKIIHKELGSSISKNAKGEVVADHLNQHGSVGYKVMGFATTIIADEAILRAEYNVTAINQTVADTDRTGFVKTETAGSGE